jgi:signal transduction histidine kinase
MLGMQERAEALGGPIHLQRGKERGTIATVTVPA